MKDVFIEAKSLPGAYHRGIQKLSSTGELADCQDWSNTFGEKQLECRMTIHIEEPMSEPRISKLLIANDFQLFKHYELEMTEGLLDYAADITKDNGEPLEDYTYHHRMVHPIDQIQFVIDDLKRSPSSRRAVIDIRDISEDCGAANPACLQNIQFFIRNGKLDMCTLYRSNDFAQAWFTNAWGNIKLQEMIAEELGVPVGTYSQTSNSMHVYEKNFTAFDGFVRRIEKEGSPDSDELAYYYEGDWKEEIDACEEDIRATHAEKKAYYSIK